MNDVQELITFSVRFSDKNIWKDFKDDMKVILKENEIKFQYSEKTPTFHILYQSDVIKIRVAWEEETLLFALQAEKDITPEQIEACREIYDLLILFSGTLEDGYSPYEW